MVGLPKRWLSAASSLAHATVPRTRFRDLGPQWDELPHNNQGLGEAGGRMAVNLMTPVRRIRARPVPGRITMLTLAACLGAAAHTAAAAHGNVFSATVGVTSIWDNNLFLLPDAAGLAPRPDYLVAPYAKLKIDKTFSRQRLILDALVTDYRYGHYTQLNFVSPKYEAKWRWAFARHLAGTIRASGDKRLSSFAYFRKGNSGNVLTTHNESVSLDWWVGGGLHVFASGFLRSAHNSQRFRQVDSSRQHGAQVGLKYLSEAGSWIAVHFSRSHGDYPTRSLTEQDVSLLDRRFDRKNAEIEFNWLIDRQITLQATAGHLSLVFPDVVQRDFSGNYGSLQVTWSPFETVQLALGARRRLSQWQDAIASYRATDTLFLTPTWALSHTVSLQLTVQRERVTFRGHHLAITPPGLPFRDDHLSSVELGLIWKPTRRVAITLSGQASRRDSGPYANYGIYRYSDRIASLDANIGF